MSNKKFKTELRYRGSRDGWRANDFHRMSNFLSSTATLFKIKDNGHCIGGFTSKMWGSPETHIYETDSTAMLFNLSARRLFECKNHSKAIYNCKGKGPRFGLSELEAEEPFNGED